MDPPEEEIDPREHWLTVSLRDLEAQQQETQPPDPEDDNTPFPSMASFRKNVISWKPEEPQRQQMERSARVTQQQQQRPTRHSRDPSPHGAAPLRRDSLRSHGDPPPSPHLQQHIASVPSSNLSKPPLSRHSQDPPSILNQVTPSSLSSTQHQWSDPPESPRRQQQGGATWRWSNANSASVTSSNQKRMDPPPSIVEEPQHTSWSMASQASVESQKVSVHAPPSQARVQSPPPPPPPTLEEAVRPSKRKKKKKKTSSKKSLSVPKTIQVDPLFEKDHPDLRMHEDDYFPKPIKKKQPDKPSTTTTTMSTSWVLPAPPSLASNDDEHRLRPTPKPQHTTSLLSTVQPQTKKKMKTTTTESNLSTPNKVAANTFVKRPTQQPQQQVKQQQVKQQQQKVKQHERKRAARELPPIQPPKNQTGRDPSFRIEPHNFQPKLSVIESPRRDPSVVSSIQQQQQQQHQVPPPIHKEPVHSVQPDVENPLKPLHLHPPNSDTKSLRRQDPPSVHPPDSSNSSEPRRVSFAGEPDQIIPAPSFFWGTEKARSRTVCLLLLGLLGVVLLGGIAVGLLFGLDLLDTSNKSSEPGSVQSTTHYLPYGPALPGDENENFGYSVALSRDGSTLAALKLPSDYRLPASVQLFSSSAEPQWEPLGSPIVGLEQQGSGEQLIRLSLSQNGTIAAIGFGSRNGYVRIYQFAGNEWQPLGPELRGGDGDHFGASVSLSSDGSLVAVGAPQLDSGTGYVQTFSYRNATWVPAASPVVGTTVGERFGTATALSVDGTYLAVGAPGTSAGRVQLFYTAGGSQWVPIGGGLRGSQDSDGFGSSLALSGDGGCVAVGAPQKSDPEDPSQGLLDNPGYVRVYCLQNSVWRLLGGNSAQVLQGTMGSNFYFGENVALSSGATTLAVNAYANDAEQGVFVGQVRVFHFRDSDNSGEGKRWALASELFGEEAFDFFGFSIGLSGRGNLLAVGAPLHSEQGPFSGQVQVFLQNDCTQEGDTEESCSPVSS